MSFEPRDCLRHILVNLCTVVAAFSCGSGDLVAAPGWLQTPLTQLDLNHAVASSPRALREGSATLDQVKAWLESESAYLPDAPSWEVEERDLDGDGVADVLIADPRLSGSGGFSYSAFLRTRRGLRYIGAFLGRVRALPLQSDQTPRVVIATASGSGRIDLQLADIRPTGLHRLRTAQLAAGDSGTAEGNRLAQALMRADVVTAETLREIFGTAATRQPSVLGAFDWDTTSGDVRWDDFGDRIQVQVMVITESIVGGSTSRWGPFPIDQTDVWVLTTGGGTLRPRSRPDREHEPIGIGSAGTRYSFWHFSFDPNPLVPPVAVVLRIGTACRVFPVEWSASSGRPPKVPAQPCGPIGAQ